MSTREDNKTSRTILEETACYVHIAAAAIALLFGAGSVQAQVLQFLVTFAVFMMLHDQSVRLMNKGMRNAYLVGAAELRAGVASRPAGRRRRRASCAPVEQLLKPQFRKTPAESRAALLPEPRQDPAAEAERSFSVSMTMVFAETIRRN